MLGGSEAAIDAARLEVRVVDVDGIGIPDAVVAHPRGRGVTNLEGRVRLPALGCDLGMPSQDRYWKRLTVRAPGYAPVVHQAAWSPYPYELVRLRDRALRVAGRCVDDSGRPIGGVALTLGELDLRSDAEGRFETDEAPSRALMLQHPGPCRPQDRLWGFDSQVVVPPDENVLVRCRRWEAPSAVDPDDPVSPPPSGPQAPKAQDPWEVEPATVRLELESLERTRVRDGTVRLRRTGTRQVVQSDRIEWLSPPGTADETCFRLHPVEPGRYDVVWQPRRGDPDCLVCQDVYVPAGREIDLGVVWVPRPQRLVVRVRDAAGLPLAGAAVVTNIGRPPLAVRTDVAGLAELRISDPVGLEIEVAAPDHLPRRILLHEGWAGPIDARLGR